MSEEQSGGLIVLFGATGDLTSRMLLPALHQLYQRGLLSENFALIGAARTTMSDEAFQKYVKKSVENGPNFTKLNEAFLDHCRYLATDNTNIEDLKELRKKLKQLSKEFETPEEYIYYYSISPELYGETTNNIKKAQITELKGNHRVIVEKPVGDSLKAAKKYHHLFLDVFDEKNIYYMDHFPGMDFIQNILATRFFNPFIEGIWNNQFIENIQISLPENLSIGTRGNYYDKTGVLLDMFQNHLLQILSLVAMELPDKLTTESIHANKLAILKNLPLFTKEQVEKKVVRGQYKADSLGEFKSYRDEKNVPSDSNTDTYVAIELAIDTPRWKGVPFYLRTGKALIEDYTAIDILLKPTGKKALDVPTRLTFMAEPTQGFSLVLNQKTPNNKYEPLTTFIGPDRKTFKDKYIAHPYENMIHDALAGERIYFPTFPEIKEQWRITDSILSAWEQLPAPPFPNYQANTFGPLEAEELLTKNNHAWIKRI
ncbi:glucose-6-phosphate 1-dehydrogenase [Carnobacterium iners]|uniref:Glucose-6-phosphate 1-dehydrogenase n=1 Tax=Carnobacterium iners TaxID=1073423 RepID=A0A1X7MTC6_9LACT|nr:glucose-6-phosphate dehydrogenase [Carnobacterium iners]SEK57967.1 glucose-6-phosphate 1-dehydrogenase [Carnobacterium iners]SMH28070.1 glucose-6-phosphate 1-dehydrogenase [Carnobacterium iners]